MTPEELHMAVWRPLPKFDPLPGVFAFLDAVLPEEIRKIAMQRDLGVGSASLGDERRIIAKYLNVMFRLQWSGCPLRDRLAEYRLFNRNEMADALAAAYGLQKRGGNPDDALKADYSGTFYGLLYWCDVEVFRNSPEGSYKGGFWEILRYHYQPGDHLVEYNRPVSSGYLIFRNDRLVWEVESIRKTAIGVSLKWKAQKEHFIALGGTTAFLNGQFIWPPADWVNPVSDEEEAESLGQGLKFLSKPQASSSAGG